MADDLRRLEICPKTGCEIFHKGGQSLGYSLHEFWAWSLSDLVSNATRGRLAEFIVAQALGIDTDTVRDEWSAYDLETADGVKIEVKSAAYLQSWHQEKLSDISFLTPKTRSWDPESNQLENESRRQADVYVFALLAHKDKGSIDPLNVSQWRFFVLPTHILDRRVRSQHSITLPTLNRLSGGSFGYHDLKAAVESTANK